MIIIINFGNTNVIKHGQLDDNVIESLGILIIIILW